MKEERRIVSVLFADVSGFTAMSESLDPEDVRSIMNDCFERLSREIYSHGGVVDKYVGDNVMALFGVPAAREDDAERAVRAALAMQKSLREFSAKLARERGFELKMRVGINTGLVVAGDVGSEKKSAFTVMGDAVNLASRIEHHCRPGEVWVGRSTFQAARREFEFARQEPIAVKGKKAPQVFYQALGERGGEEEGQPFAGREKELKALTAALEEARAGSFRLVTVSGEAGVGKSRLVKEFLSRASGARQFSSCALCAEAAPYSIFEPVISALGVTAAPDDDAGKGAFFQAVEKALKAESGRAPLIMVLEDLHVADSGSWELLSFLINSLQGSRILMICLMRPEAEKKALWSCSQGRRTLAVKPLAEADSLSVVEQSLGANKLPKEVKLEIARAADGNAFFLTELLLNLKEGGGIHRNGGGWELSQGYRLEVPENVQGVVLSRMDRLEPSSKELLQVASCSGLEFAPEVVDALEPALAPAGERLEPLAARRFIETRPQTGWAFVHAILRDVCYESLLKERRRLYHRRLGEFWEKEAEADRCSDALFKTADHYYLCREPRKALLWNWRAGLSDEKCFLGQCALRYFQRTLELMDAEEGEPGLERPSRALVLFKLGDMHTWVFAPDEALDCYHKCLDLIDESDPLWVSAYRKLAVVYNIRGQARRAEEMFEKAASCVEGRPVTEQTLGLYYEVATAFFRSGQDDKAAYWLGRIVKDRLDKGVPIPVPPDSDVYTLIPAFSGLVAPKTA